MKKSVIVIGSLFFVLVLTSFKVFNLRQPCNVAAFDPKMPTIQNSGGIDGASGSPIDLVHYGGTGYCADCHGTTSTGLNISINAPGLSGGYTPGQTYTISVVLSKNAINLYGFNFEAQTSSKTNAGTFSITNPANTQLYTVSGTTNVSHKTGATGTGSFTFTFNWTAPASASVGVVTFYAAGIGANANGSDTGDFTTKTTMVINPIATGINEVTADHSIKLFPIPAHDNITIQLNQQVSSNTVVKIFSLDGKEMAELNYSISGNELKTEIPSTLSKGFYFVKVISEEKTLSEKIIIQ
ncbi:MAG: T9SS type A sorting domain-containing protein [Bacteroidia bacterium]